MYDRRQREMEGGREIRKGGREKEREKINSNNNYLNSRMQVRAEWIFKRQFELRFWNALCNKQSHLGDL